MRDIAEILKDLDEESQWGGALSGRAATALREQAKEIERLQADAIHTCHDNCQRTACVLRRRVAELEADLQGAEQRVLREFAEWCDSQAMRCKYGQTAVEWAQRAEIVREHARQRAQAEGSDQ